MYQLEVMMMMMTVIMNQLLSMKRLYSLLEETVIANILFQVHQSEMMMIMIIPKLLLQKKNIIIVIITDKLFQVHQAEVMIMTMMTNELVALKGTITIANILFQVYQDIMIIPKMLLPLERFNSLQKKSIIIIITGMLFQVHPAEVMVMIMTMMTNQLATLKGTTY